MSSRLAALALPTALVGACATTAPVASTPSSPPPPTGSTSPVPLPAPPMPTGADLTGNVHVLLGIPVDADPTDDYLIDRTYWVASYNPDRLVANWVAWSLSTGDFGSTGRRETFRADTALPDAFKKVGKDAYRNSGYDRGHLCPSADRTASIEANDATFLMTNMHPQLEELNRNRWKQVEEKERSFAAGGKHLQIVAGGIFSASPTTIGPDVAVPDANYKIIVLLEAGQTAGDVMATTIVCSFIMPNRPEVKDKKWFEYLVSVDEVEKQTGYDFLHDVPDEVEQAIEARVPTPQECGASR